MAFWNKKHTLLEAVDDWVDRNVINSTIADSLRLDIDENIKSRSFSYIPILLGIICLAFGFITFVAANWDVMSNLARVALLIVSMLISWAISIYLMIRGPNWAAQLFVLLACAIFGASIMLIAQIYHMQGEPKDAVWLWAAGTLLAAVLTRSTPSLALGITLITLWMLMEFNVFGRAQGISFMYLFYWLICAVVTWWLASRFSAHLLMVGLALWVVVGTQSVFQYSLANLCLFGAYAIIAILLCELELKGWLKGFEQAAVAYLVIIITFFLLNMLFSWSNYSTKQALDMDSQSWLLGVFCLFTISVAFFAYWKNVSNKYDIAIAAVFSTLNYIATIIDFKIPFEIEAIVLATQIWIIRMGWRLEYRPLSVIGFLGFSLVMLIFYFKTMDSLMDTSLFYFGAGLILVIGAVALPKMLKRMGPAS